MFSTYLHLSSLSATVPVGGCLQVWFPLTRLPGILPAVPCIFVWLPPIFDGISSHTHLLIGIDFVSVIISIIIHWIF